VAAARRDRIVSALLVMIMHAAGLWWLLQVAAPLPDHPAVDRGMATFDVAPPEAPPINHRAAPTTPKRAPAAIKAPQSPARPARRASPLPVEAPPAIVPIPLVTLPAAPLVGAGLQMASGATDAGTGTGGAAGRGDGGGSGGGTAARLLDGTIRARDYPKQARRDGIEGVVTVGFTVGRDGRARACRVLRSSGSALLDTTTCALIERRYRYAPARDAAGNPVAEERGWQQRWWIERGN
jgi:protein TonB